MKKKKEEEERNYQSSLNEPPQAPDTPTPLSSSISSKTPGGGNKEFKFSLEEIEREIKEDSLGTTPSHGAREESVNSATTPNSATQNDEENNNGGVAIDEDMRKRTVSIEDVVPTLQSIAFLNKSAKKATKKK